MIAAEILKRFVEDFGVPFLTGKQVTIGDALGLEGHDAIRHALNIEPTMVDAIDCTVPLKKAVL